MIEWKASIALHLFEVNKPVIVKMIDCRAWHEMEN